MKPDELFEMLTDIDEKFIDDAMPESKKTDVVQPQKIQMTKRRFPWRIAAACLAVCVAVGAVIAVKVGKGKIDVPPSESVADNPSGNPIWSTMNTVQPIPAKTIYTGTETLPLDFIVAEVNLKFEISENKYLSLINWGAVASIADWYSSGVFPSGVTIRSVYLCDLNGDGYREIAAAVTAENDDKFVSAYDVKFRREYEYKIEKFESRRHYDSLTLKDDRLYLCTEDGSEVSQEPLSLENMDIVSTKLPDVEVVNDVTIIRQNEVGGRTQEFAIGEFPNDKFYVNGKSVFVKKYGNKSVDDIFYQDIYSVYLWDMNGDGKREIVVVCGENGVRSNIRVYDYANGEEYCLNIIEGANLVVKEDGLYITYDGQADQLLALKDMEKVVITPESDYVQQVAGLGGYLPEFTMPEFPDYKFAINWGELYSSNSMLSVSMTDPSGETKYIINFLPLEKVWLSDLNGDGKREVIAMGWNGLSGLAATYLRVYDVANGKLYALDSHQYNHGFGDFDLTIKDDRVYFEYRYCGLDNKYVTETNPLTLDVMNEVDENYNPETEIVFDETTRNDFFTMPEYPDFEFAFVDGDIEAHNNQTDTITKLLDTIEIRKVYLYDDYRTHKRTIYTLARRAGEQNTVVCLTYLNRDGKFVTSYIEPNEKGYDLDLTIGEYGRPTWSDSSPIAEPIHKSVETEKVTLTVDSDKSTYKQGDTITVTAEVYNKTDKTVYLYSPVVLYDGNPRMCFRAVLIDSSGKEISTSDTDGLLFDTAVDYFPVEPGQTVSTKMTFNTVNMEIGTYDGICYTVVSDNPRSDSQQENCEANFQLTIE